MDITTIDGNIILHTGDYYYSNKPLKDFTCDDFAEYIIDSCCPDPERLVLLERNCLLYYLYEIDYLDCIPATFARVYCYGVWQVLKSHINQNEKHVLSPKQRSLIKRRTNVWDKAQEKFREEWHNNHAEIV